MKFYFVLFPFFITACHQQLPDSKMKFSESVDMVDFNKKYGVIPDGNVAGMANQLNQVVGSYCIPSSEGDSLLCSGSFSQSQCFGDENDNVEVTASVAYPSSEEYLFNSSSNSQVGVLAFPLRINLSDEELETAKVELVAIASIKNGKTGRSSAPNSSQMTACVKNMRGSVEGFNEVYWIKSANVITVTTTLYTKVDSAADVDFYGFGLNGKTYNKKSEAKTNVFVGLELSRIPVHNSSVLQTNSLLKGNVFDTNPSVIFLNN
ncbi:hypothetical protein ACCW92_09760 [Enterobacter soli]|uniref:hypothetical protein n=1 Tax=Enterobacter soli TaxID=885040 RepID=UPI003ED9018E